MKESAVTVIAKLLLKSLPRSLVLFFSVSTATFLANSLRKQGLYNCIGFSLSQLPFPKPLSKFVTGWPVSTKFGQGREISIAVSKPQKSEAVPRSVHTLQPHPLPFYASKDRSNQWFGWVFLVWVFFCQIRDHRVYFYYSFSFSNSKVIHSCFSTF